MHFFLKLCLALILLGFLVCLALFIWGAFDHFYHVQPLVSKAKVLEVTPITARGFSVSKIPSVIDVIIIGSGMGGLTTAALLARRGLNFNDWIRHFCIWASYCLCLICLGKKVLLLEQHDKLGGCTHSFDEKGFEFDSGLHVWLKYVCWFCIILFKTLSFSIIAAGISSSTWAERLVTQDLTSGGCMRHYRLGF